MKKGKSSLSVSTSSRNAMVALSVAITAVAVFFISQAYATTTKIDSVHTNDSMTNKAEKVVSTPIKAEVDVTQRSTADTNTPASKGSTAASNTKTDVSLNGTSVWVNGNGNVHKVIRSDDGSMDVTIKSNSTSHGSNESSLDIDVNYSSTTEVDHSTTSE